MKQTSCPIELCPPVRALQHGRVVRPTDTGNIERFFRDLERERETETEIRKR